MIKTRTQLAPNQEQVYARHKLQEHQRKKHRPNQRSTDRISRNLRKSLLPVPNPINIQGSKGIPTPVLTTGKPEIFFLHTVCIRTLPDHALTQPHHIPRGLAPILALHTPIL